MFSVGNVCVIKNNNFIFSVILKNVIYINEGVLFFVKFHMFSVKLMNNVFWFTEFI